MHVKDVYSKCRQDGHSVYKSAGVTEGVSVPGAEYAKDVHGTVDQSLSSAKSHDSTLHCRFRLWNQIETPTLVLFRLLLLLLEFSLIS